MINTHVRRGPRIAAIVGVLAGLAGCDYLTVPEAEVLIEQAKIDAYEEYVKPVDERVRKTGEAETVDVRIGRLLNMVFKLHEDFASLKKDIGKFQQTVDRQVADETKKVNQLNTSATKLLAEAKRLDLRATENATQLDECVDKLVRLDDKVKQADLEAATSYDATVALLHHQLAVFKTVKVQLDALVEKLGAAKVGAKPPPEP